MKKISIMLAIIVICSLTIIGCTAQTPTTQAPSSGATNKPVPTTSTTPQHGGIMKIIMPNGPGPMGWPPESTTPATQTQQMCLQYLVTEQLDGTINPGLATSWELNTDPTNASITFHLRQGVKFHDGTAMNAQAIKWNLDQIKAGVTNAGSTQNWKSIDIIDDYTVRVNFTDWNNLLLRTFGGAATPICSPTAYQKNGVDWMRWNMVGTGPFKQVDFQKDVFTKTTRFDDYWEAGKPYLAGLEYDYVVDSFTQVALFKSGGGDMLQINNAKTALDLQNQGYRIDSAFTRTDVLDPDGLNADSPWSNLKVRMAAEYAIDKEAIAKTVGLNFWQAAYGIAPPGSGAYDPKFSGIRQYDPAKAKQLLAEAGYPNGFTTKIISPQGNQDVQVALQDYLGKAGIKADLEFLPNNTFMTYAQSKWQNGLIFDTLSAFPNYNSTLRVLFSPTTNARPSMKKPDAWEKTYSDTLNSPTANVELMRTAVQKLYDDCTVISLFHEPNMYAEQPYVHDSGILTRGSFYQWYPQNAWLSK